MAEKIKHFVSTGSGVKGLVNKMPDGTTSRLDINYFNESERLSQPCEEQVDLRDLFPGHCYPYQHGGITHFLDTHSERFFLKQLKAYDGQYTQGVYEAVLKNAAAQLASGIYGDAEEEAEEEIFQPPTVIPVGYSQLRQENRLNFATDVSIELPSGIIIKGRTVDISSSGMQVKLNGLVDVVDGMSLNISFPMIEEKYEKHFGQVPYRLMKTDVGSLFVTLKLARIDHGQHPFDLFLNNFIESKKHRYRIDAEDSKVALIAKSWEYLYIKALPYLACFVSTKGDRLQIQEIAISEQNKHQLKGLGNTMLSLIEQQMSSFRLNGITHHDETIPEIYGYRYQGIGQRKRVCATSWQFIDSKERATFIRAGINEDSFTAWSIKAVEIKNITEHRNAELIHKVARENQQQADSLQEQLDQYQYLIYLLDITEYLRRDPMLKHDETAEQPDDYFFDDYEIKRGQTAEYTRLRLGLSKQRNEERYIYHSPIVLKHYGRKVKGHTLDLSINGLKIAIEEPKTFNIRDTVTLDFVGFNKRFKSSKLKDQSYRVAAITPDGSLCLTRDHRIARHDAAMFLSKLLKQNLDVLPTCTGELWMSTKARLMETLLNQNLPSQALLLTREKSVYDVPYILSGNHTAQLMAPFQIGKDIYNLNTLLDFQKLRNKIMKLSVTTDKPASIEVYVSQHHDEETNQTVIEMKTWVDFDNDEERIEYIEKCCHNSIYAFYNLTLCKVPKLERQTLVDDMKILRSNARHYIAEFDKVCHSLIHLVELTEITDIVLDRYQFARI